MSQLAASLLGSVHSDASAVLCPPPEQTRSAMHKPPIGLSERRPERNSVSIVEQASVSTPPTVLYIDKQRLGRDCVSEQLATHLSKWAIESLASIREVPSDEDWSGLSLVILHTHGASLSTAEVADEMNAIAETVPSVPLIVMSDLDDATEVHMGIQRGARGYLPTGLPFPQALAAIRFVCNGGTYIPACVLAATSGTQRTSPARPIDANGSPIQFSPRQLQVLERLRQGKQNKMIAYELNMCESTVKVHLRHIMKKLNARNRTQVVLLTSNINTTTAVALAA